MKDKMRKETVVGVISGCVGMSIFKRFFKHDNYVFLIS